MAGDGEHEFASFVARPRIDAMQFVTLINQVLNVFLARAVTALAGRADIATHRIALCSNLVLAVSAISSGERPQRKHHSRHSTRDDYAGRQHLPLVTSTCKIYNDHVVVLSQNDVASGRLFGMLLDTNGPLS